MQIVTVKIESFEAGKVFEIVVEFHEVIMTEIDPLEHIPVGHDIPDDWSEVFDFAYFIVAEHDGAAYEFDIDSFFLFFLEFLFGLAGNVFHRACIDQCADDWVDIVLG